MMTVESDHTPISLRICVAKNIKKNITKKPRTRIRREKLKDDATRGKFGEVVWRQLEREQLECKQQMETFARALDSASKGVLTSGKRPQPGWFQAYVDVLKQITARRYLCQAMADTSSTMTDRETWLFSQNTSNILEWNQDHQKWDGGSDNDVTVISLKDQETGTPCNSPEENGELSKRNFEIKLYAID